MKVLIVVLMGNQTPNYYHIRHIFDDNNLILELNLPTRKTEEKKEVLQSVAEFFLPFLISRRIRYF